jgi:hypothetical protein
VSLIPRRKDQYLDWLKAIHAQGERISEQLNRLLKEQNVMAADLTALQAQVEKTTEVEQSAVALIQGIAAQLATAKDDPVKVQGIIDQLNSSASSLAAAVTANTPAA